MTPGRFGPASLLPLHACCKGGLVVRFADHFDDVVSGRQRRGRNRRDAASGHAEEPPQEFHPVPLSYPRDDTTRAYGVDTLVAWCVHGRGSRGVPSNSG